MAKSNNTNILMDDNWLLSLSSSASVESKSLPSVSSYNDDDNHDTVVAKEEAITNIYYDGVDAWFKATFSIKISISTKFKSN